MAHDEIPDDISFLLYKYLVFRVPSIQIMTIFSNFCNGSNINDYVIPIRKLNKNYA
jgi:hypothetical protein